VDEFIAADSHPDVRRAGALRRKEEQIAWLDRVRSNPGSFTKLLADGPRHSDAVLSEDVPDEPAAIEP
jgi:hypothetical protein